MCEFNSTEVIMGVYDKSINPVVLLEKLLQE